MYYVSLLGQKWPRKNGLGQRISTLHQRRQPIWRFQFDKYIQMAEKAWKRRNWQSGWPRIAKDAKSKIWGTETRIGKSQTTKIGPGTWEVNREFCDVLIKEVCNISYDLQPASKMWISYSLKNRRQLHIFFTQAKTWHRIVCWFSWISQFLMWP